MSRLIVGKNWGFRFICKIIIPYLIFNHFVISCCSLQTTTYLFIIYTATDGKVSFIFNMVHLLAIMLLTN